MCTASGILARQYWVSILQSPKLVAIYLLSTICQVISLTNKGAYTQSRGRPVRFTHGQKSNCF